eukprot:SAG25_NODE_1000_length_4352_cov_31.202680_7_plen_130_part_00
MATICYVGLGFRAVDSTHGIFNTTDDASPPLVARSHDVRIAASIALFCAGATTFQAQLSCTGDEIQHHRPIVDTRNNDADSNDSRNHQHKNPNIRTLCLQSGPRARRGTRHDPTRAFPSSNFVTRTGVA